MGKLLSALVWVFLLIAASIPMLAVVFVFGGVGPESVVPGYLVLLAVALGLGSFGLLCSSLVKRTTAATAVTVFGVLAVTIGTAFILIFWNGLSEFDENGNRIGHFGIRTPVILAYLNPFIAQADVMCTTENTFGGGWCGLTNEFIPTVRHRVRRWRRERADAGAERGRRRSTLPSTRTAARPNLASWRR